MRIISINRIPRWKFWKIENYEVLVEYNGFLQKITIYDCDPIKQDQFADFVKNKLLYGKQWGPKYVSLKKLKSAEALAKLRGLIGKEIEES